MKNILYKLIEKCKNLRDLIQQNTKIKYGIIAGLLGVVIITIAIFTPLGMKETTELPTNDTSRPAISTYDKTTIITIVGEELDSGNESEISGDPNESDSDSNTAENTDNVTTEVSSDTTYGPADNENTEGSDDPVPADPSNMEPQVTSQQNNTPANNTQGTSNNSTNTQNATKPPVTTQSTPKPPVATQNTAKPPETAQNPTDPVVNSDAFEVNEKKYDYNGGNVTILNVKNLSSKAYTITIKCTYKDANGKTLKTESKTFEGFPAGWSNYFVFQPGIKYDSFAVEMKANEYNEKTYAQGIDFGSHAKCELTQLYADNTGKIYYYPETSECKLSACVIAKLFMKSPSYTGSGTLGINSQYVVFDNSGDILTISNPEYKGQISSSSGGEEVAASIPLFGTGYTWGDRDKYVMPENLKNITVIKSVIAVAEE